MAWLYFLQQCLNAIQVSCFYALLAAAYVLVHGIANRINLAFGSIAMWGAYLTIGGVAVVSASSDFPLSAVAFAVVYAVIGTAARRLRHRPDRHPAARRPALARHADRHHRRGDRAGGGDARGERQPRAPAAADPGRAR